MHHDDKPKFPTHIPTPEQMKEAVECGIQECMPDVMAELESVVIEQASQIKALLPTPQPIPDPSFKSGVWVGLGIGIALFIGLLSGLFVGTLL